MKLLASFLAYLYFKSYQLRGVEFANGFDQVRRVFISGIISKAGAPHLLRPKSLNDIIRKQMLTNPAKNMVTLADKSRAFEIVKCEFLSPRQNISVHESFDLLDFPLNSSFVAKASNDSGSAVFFPDGCKSESDKEKLAALFSSLNTSYGLASGEDWYSLIDPKVVIEPLICDVREEMPTDFKLHFYKGNFWFLQVIRGRFSDSFRETLFDKNLNRLEFNLDQRMEADQDNFLHRELVYSMVECGELLIKDYEYARVDFLEVNGEVFFGEVTFAPMSGLYRGSGNRNLIRHLPI